MTLPFIRVCMLAAATVAAAACGGSGGGSPTAPTGSGAGATPMTITITSRNGAQSFSPNPASAGGRAVVFRNADSIVHRVQLNDGSIDTGDIAPGATSRTITMPATGTNYHCTLHPEMVGAVNPQAGGAPPECTGPYCD